jgi:hypothetical protein
MQVGPTSATLPSGNYQDKNPGARKRRTNYAEVHVMGNSRLNGEAAIVTGVSCGKRGADEVVIAAGEKYTTASAL